MSQQEIADKVGIDRSYYTKIENGLRPSVDVAQQLSKVLDFKWTIFFDENCAKTTQNNKAREAI
nr:MAG TPA: Helix-turn-helix XRE-family like protein [Caudoviricetes sp.]